MNPIVFNTYNQMNAIYVNINMGMNVSPQMVPNLMVRSATNSFSSPSLSLSPLSQSSESSPQSSQFSSRVQYSGQSSGQISGQFSGQISGQNSGQNSGHIPNNLANNLIFDSIRYKTELCKNMMELGECKFGDKCYYAHFPHELKVATYKHKNYKTQLCRPFHSEGFCDFGNRCAFIHTKPDIDKILNSLESFLSSVPPLPALNAEEEVIGNQLNEKRLKVFKRMSSK